VRDNTRILLLVFEMTVTVEAPQAR